VLKLRLDDKRPAPPGWALAQSYEDAIDLIREHGAEIAEVSLDHDLCEAHSDGETGCDVLQFLLESGSEPRQ
jgi:hypothetical protein